MTIKNVKIVNNSFGGYLVKGTTERFGENEILFESPFIEECIQYLKENGYDYVIEEIKKGNKIQLGSSMYRKIRLENGKIFVHEKWVGWKEVDFEGFRFIAPLVLRRRTRIPTTTYPGGYTRKEHFVTETMKIGSGCTW